MAEGPALWRSGLAIGLCLGVGLAAGPLAVAVADAGAGPLVSVLGSAGVRWREPIAFGAVMAVLVVVFGLFIGWIAKAGRFVAGWLFGFAITESVWRPAIQNVVDGGKAEPALEALVTAALLSLIAAVAIDAGRRVRWSPFSRRGAL